MTTEPEKEDDADLVPTADEDPAAAQDSEAHPS